MKQLFFISDPLCSWCWAMAPEIKTVTAALKGRVQSQLLLGGLGIEKQSPLDEVGWLRLHQLWERVEAVTGRTFTRPPASFRFVYNSAKSCRALLAVQQLASEYQLDYLEALQEAFFLHSLDISLVDVQASLASQFDISRNSFLAALQAIDNQQLTDAFARAKGYGTSALPSVLFESAGVPRRLLAGGFITADYLLAELVPWLQGDKNA